MKTVVRGFASAAALIALAALLVPLAGAALDHHFAERQPDHLHVGLPHLHAHLHAFERGHHPHHHPTERGASPIALYKSDGGALVMLAASPRDVESAMSRQFQPTSVFVLPAPLVQRPNSALVPPPDKPPSIL